MSGREGGVEKQARRGPSLVPDSGRRGTWSKRAEVRQASEPSRPTLPDRTYGTKEHLALETGQTLAPPRPPRPQPPIHRQVDSTREIRVTEPSCHTLCVWSLARGLCLAL